MNKNDFISLIAESADVSKKDATNVVMAMVNILNDFPENEDSLTLFGFGKFYTRVTSDRKGRNPQTGEAITIAGRKSLAFKASKNPKE